MSTLADLIVAAAQAAGLDPKLAIEVASAESSLQPYPPDSSTGAIGPFQIMPATGLGLGYSPEQLRDPATNVQAGVKYLTQMLQKFQDPAAALAAYNWGPGRMDANLAQYGSDWFSHIPASTQAYVQKILGNVSNQYAAAVGPIPVPLAMPGLISPAAGGISMWTQVAIAVGVIFGISLLLSEG